jgi:hypothetical protein
MTSHTITGLSSEDVYLVIAALRLYSSAVDSVAVELDSPPNRASLINRLHSTERLFADHWYGNNGNRPRGCLEDCIV